MSVQWNTGILSFITLVVAIFSAQFMLVGFKIWRISFAQDPKAAKIAQHSFQPATTFRLQGIPTFVSEQPVSQKKASKLLKKAWNLDHDVNLTIYSLATDPFDVKRKVATFTFQQVPAFFRPPQQVWTKRFRDTDGTPVFLQLDLNFLGFTPLHSTSDRDCTVDIVALSGLNGHAFGSFKERGRDKCFMWLRDVLPEHFPLARIFIYGYDSKLTETQNFQEIPDLALNFRNYMSNLVAAKPRQLILIGHSLGGIIVKEALIQLKAAKDANDAWSSDATAMLGRILALLFFGAPSEGLDNEALELMVKGQPNDRLVKNLGRSSGVLRTQMMAFRRVFEELDFLTFWYYELENTPTPKLSDNGQWKMTGECRKLVEPTSATNGNPHDFGRHLVRGISRNHSEMVKFQGVHDNVYKTIRGDLAKCFSRERNDEQLLPHDQEDILQTLAYSAQDFRRDNIERATNHTCEWFFNSKEFCTWEKNSKQNPLDTFLWVKGKPGTGKSTLMLEAERYTRRHFTGEPTTVISFFFHARGEVLEKSPLGLYRSLVHQLLSQDPGSWKALHSIFKAKVKGNTYKNISWSRRDLEECLIQAFKPLECKPAVIFIDALDECPDNDAILVVDFFMGLMRQIGETNYMLRVCLSSRHYPGIATCGCPEVVMEQKNAGDIQTYIESELHEKLPNYNDLLELQRIIFKKSRSVFLWVKLVITRLKQIVIRQPGQTRKVLEQELEKVPSELQNLFSGLFDMLSLEEREQATFLIQITSCARIPLSLEQTIAVLPFRSQSLYTTLDAWEKSDDYILGTENQMIMVTRLSCGLIEFDSNSRCQFIHETVREYFLRSHNFSILSRSKTPMDVVAWSNDAIANASIRYMKAFIREAVGVKSDSIDDGCRSKIRELYNKDPILRYLVVFVHDHIEAAETGQISQEGASELFEELDDQFTKLRAYIDPNFELELSYTLLHACCKICLSHLHTISRLIEMEQNPEAIINKPGGRHDTYPLIDAASAQGDHKEVVDLLLLNGARIDVRDNIGANALQQAIQNGNLAVMEVLLSHGADVNFVYHGEPLLCYTARTNRREATEILLRHGAKVDKEDESGETPIIVAGSSMSLAVFPALIKAGANVNSRDHMGALPLKSAYEQLCKKFDYLAPTTYEAVKSCIEAGQDLEMLCEGNRTLLETLLDWSEVIGKETLDGDQRESLRQIVCLLTGGKT